MELRLKSETTLILEEYSVRDVRRSIVTLEMHGIHLEFLIVSIFFELPMTLRTRDVVESWFAIEQAVYHKCDISRAHFGHCFRSAATRNLRFANSIPCSRWSASILGSCESEMP